MWTTSASARRAEATVTGSRRDKNGTPPTDGERAVAATVRAHCVRTLEDAWEDASMQGLCAEGAFEYALDQLRHLSLDDLLDDGGAN